MLMDLADVCIATDNTGMTPTSFGDTLERMMPAAPAYFSISDREPLSAIASNDLFNVTSLSNRDHVQSHFVGSQVMENERTAGREVTINRANTIDPRWQQTPQQSQAIGAFQS